MKIKNLRKAKMHDELMLYYIWSNPEKSNVERNKIYFKYKRDWDGRTTKSTYCKNRSLTIRLITSRKMVAANMTLTEFYTISKTL